MEASGPGAQTGKAHIDWVPAQHKPSDIQDLRGAKRGPKGYKERSKRKLQEMEEIVAADTEELVQGPGAMDADGDAGPGSGGEEGQAPKRLRIVSNDGVPYIPVSGRTWKVAGRRAAEVMKSQAASTSWEKKMAAKASRENFLEQKRAAMEASKAKRKEAAMQRKEAAERKKVNRAKSEVTQKITSNATLKKMMKSKKQKKLLRKADTN